MQTRDEIKKRYSPLIPALDVSSVDSALELAESVREYVDVVKVGLRLFMSEGPESVKRLKDRGFEVFLDLKLHDIPNTVGAACSEVADLEPLMITVHGTGGAQMIGAARSSLDEHCSRVGLREPIIVAITVLTSMDEAEFDGTGFSGTVEEAVTRLADLAWSSGATGLVASPREAGMIRDTLGEEAIIITPGVRLPEEHMSDQRRVGTPWGAVEAGADFVVMGRSITGAKDPGGVARAVMEGIDDVSR